METAALSTHPEANAAGKPRPPGRPREMQTAARF
jgi:hypothetical protein